MQHSDWTDYLLELVEDGIIDSHTALLGCLGWMSNDEIYEMLDANELSPRLLFGEEDE